MADNSPLPQFVMELTVLSVENLKKPASSALFSRRSRPHVSITKFNGDKLLVPIESNFFAKNSYIYLQLHSKRLLGRRTQLGWCRIPAADIGEPPVGSVRHLSYKLRSKDGSTGNGFVDLQLKLGSYGCLVYSGQEVIGMPVKILPPPNQLS